jgi:hypothetical protein
MAALILASACESEGDVTDPGDELAVGTIVGRVDGSDWSSSTAFALFANGRLVAAGTGSQNLTLGFGVTAQAPGTYTTDGSASAYGSLADTNNTVWETAGAGGSGTITITRFASNEVSGTFSFTVVRTSGAGAPPTRSITNGRFRVRY